MKRTLLLTYFSFLTLVLTAQDSLFVLLETDTVFATSCDSVDYCVGMGGTNPYFYSEVRVNGVISEAIGFCDIDTISLYSFGTVSPNGPWTVETELNGQVLNFTANALEEIVDTFNVYHPDCLWEYDETLFMLTCYGGHSLLGELMISNSDGYATLLPSNIIFSLGFTLRLDYGENEIIMTHEDGYADTSVVSVIHEEQILEAVELNLSIGESEAYFAESECGSEMFTFINLCAANATGAAELITNGNSYEIKAVSAGIDTVCVQYTDEFGFSKRQDFYLSVLTSTEEVEDFQLDIYPNPTTDFIIVATHEMGDLIEIKDIKGQVILMMSKENEEERINIDYFPKGVYFISVRDNRGRKQTNVFLKN